MAWHKKNKAMKFCGVFCPTQRSRALQPPRAGGGPRAQTKCHYLTAVSEGLLFPGRTRAEIGGHLARRPLRGLRDNRACRDRHLTARRAGPAGDRLSGHGAPAGCEQDAGLTATPRSVQGQGPALPGPVPSPDTRSSERAPSPVHGALSSAPCARCCGALCGCRVGCKHWDGKQRVGTAQPDCAYTARGRNGASPRRRRSRPWLRGGITCAGARDRPAT